MGLVKTVLLGRKNGVRSRIRRAFSGDPPPDTSPNSSASAPTWQAATPVASTPARPEPPKDVTPPEGFEVVLHRDALASGEVTEIIIGGTAIALGNVDGDFHACANSCPHADGPLGEGSLEGTVLTCPYHGWRFDLGDGTCHTNPQVKVKIYEVEVVGDAVCVRL